MRELNFFNPYLSPRRSIKVGQLQVILAVVFILLVCGSIYSFNMIRIVKYSLEIRNHMAFMTDPVNIAAVKNYTETKHRVDLIQQYTKGIAPIEAELEAKSIVGSELVNKLNAAIPHEVYLGFMNITTESVSLNGIGKSRNVIAQYEHNLLNLGLFTDVFISVIEIKTEGGSEFEFTADCFLVGGASNEAKQ
jgi:Tfp pilus assembly protein PilN